MQAAGTVTGSPGRVAGRLQTLVVIGVTAVVIGVIAFVVSGPSAGGVTAVSLGADAAAAPPAVGDVAPDFTAVLPDGTPVSLAQYAGRPVWLTFGASWCADCRAEAPDIEAAYQRYRDQGLAVLGVFIDESAADVTTYAGRAGLTFPIAVDQSESVAGRYRTLGIPTHVFIGPDGRIREVRIGALHSSEMDTLVAGILR
jgi:cytochrome c biogenesis protein CcmG/thiol:disulfide interchange protein DsbE